MRRVLRSAAAIAVLVVGGACLGLGGGSALAYWTSNGSGSVHAGTATLGTVALVGVSGGPANALMPGGSADLVLTIDNTNSFAVTLIGIVGDGGIAPSGGIGGCTILNDDVSTNLPSNPSIAVPAGTHTIAVPNAVSMTTSSASGCQGATFTIPVLVTLQD